MREVLLSVKLPESWTTRMVERFSASVRMIDCRPSNNGGIQQLVEIDGRHDSLQQIVNFIEDDENVKDAHIVKTKRGRIRFNDRFDNVQDHRRSELFLHDMPTRIPKQTRRNCRLGPRDDREHLATQTPAETQRSRNRSRDPSGGKDFGC